MSIVETERPAEQEKPALAPLAWKGLSVITALVAVPLLLTLGAYGYDPDELYFVAAGGHLDWGYADQPPFVPFVAWLMDTLFPGSVYALRLPSLIVVLIGVFVAGQLAREMGGGRKAQLVSAGAYSIAFFSFATLLQTDSFNAFAWLLVSWLVVRWVRLRREGLTGRSADLPLLWAGVATAVALQVKFLIPVFWVALIVSVLIVGPRAMLRRPLLWAGGAIAVLTTVPGLIWQASNGWPQVEMARVLTAQDEILFGGRLMFLPRMLLMTGIIVGLVLFCYGLWKLFRSPLLRDFRFLGLTAVGVIAIFLISGGRFTYVAGIFPVVFAAGAVQLELGRPAAWWRWLTTWPVFALSAVPVLLALPLAPASSIEQPTAEQMQQEVDQKDLVSQVINWNDWLKQFGWPEFADSVAKAYAELPPEVRESTIVITIDSPLAAALEVLGPERGLPAQAYSFSGGFGYISTPPAEAQHVLFVGWDEQGLKDLFGEVHPMGAVEGERGTLVGTPIFFCTAPHWPLSELWPEIRTL
ncbi:glycosyltransferase family 39 protein [Amycolatopsis suaedae]|uniref:Glycosyltransferase family 39 protein n=1 Tax=Amycolatopsis suaedae TaxID=2510978 RepID=A0A4Q7J3H5_9PSEU|nr:glycosyltransferase family 39 protein [Amycolatopsis suaedae]RZQ61172.1 glycosyltransferase family 39 protein [Amycolatopsis suaedae]